MLLVNNMELFNVYIENDIARFGIIFDIRVSGKENED